MTFREAWMVLLALLSALPLPPLQGGQSTILCRAISKGVAVAGVEIVAAGKTYVTDQRGEARIEVSEGPLELTAAKDGFAPVTTTVTLAAGQPQVITIELDKIPTVQETVIVSSTRTDRGLEDQPMRVEVLDAEEIDEKLMMTPGDVVMMLNEMGGMRVQATSPSLGAASVRIQGMRGRYTRFLSDGLPLFGEQVSLGLMQIPPVDLGRVEVIKGVASSLYGAGAMGGVVNLVSRRPGAQREGQLLLNRSSRGATDAAFWDSRPLAGNWGMTLLASANGQSRSDLDQDGWADLPKYGRAVVRPRLFWDNRAGRSFFATVGGTWEDRTGGTMPGAILPAADGPYTEALTTRRTDVGAAFQALLPDGVMWSARGSWTSQHQDHEFGEVTERDDHRMGFAEVTVRRALARHTVVGGAAIERDDYQPVDVTRFAYVYTVPGVFVQDDFDAASWLALSASARLDQHNEFGTFVSPRLSGLVRHGAWSSRLSYGTGFFAPTPLTEETESAGLSRLTVDGPLKPERGSSASFDVTHVRGAFSATATLFHSAITDPVEVERSTRYALRNLQAPTTNAGVEALAIWKTDDFSFVANYTYVRSRETTDEGRVDVPLTPRHSVGLDGAWEWGSGGRLGVEWFYTGMQRLEANPYRGESRPYSVFGVLATRRVGRVSFFVNGENLTDVRQTQWEPLVRPTRGVDGRWTVDAWAPLDGRNINGGIRVFF
jgi:outer membrane receptor for ferrienterochelin and colicins